MKVLKYQLCTEVNHGTKDKPNIEQVFSAVTLGWSEANEKIAKTEAYNGEYIIEEELDNRPFKEIQTEKLFSLSEICNQTIVAGMDVETTEGIEHFSLEETDQINLTTALSAIEQGAKGYPYHADKKLCRMFTAVELKAIAEKATAHKLYHTTLCNHLLILARRATTTAELDKITYSADCLPPDLVENMKKILVAAGITE
jgi:hypothetical protein